VPINEEDETKIKSLIADSLKAAQAEQASGIQAAIQAGLQGLTGKLNAFDEKIKALEKPPEQPPKPAEKGNESAPKLEDSPAFRALKAQLEAEKQARTEAEDARKRQTLIQETRSALVAAGLSEARAGYALAALERDGTIKLDDNGKAVFVMPGQFGGTEELPASEGAKAFLKSDAGAVLLPPKDAGGSGQQRRSTRAPTTEGGKVDFDGLLAMVDGSKVAQAVNG
jgi:hypothetical protein